ESADYAKVKLAVIDAFADFTAPSFYYKISDTAVETTEDIGATWPMYAREGETVINGYLSPYPVIHIFDGSTDHWIIGQPWAESTKVDWTVWDNAQASTVYTEALWHMETFGVDPGIADVPAGWGPLSYWTTTYSEYNVVDAGIGFGLFDLTRQQIAYVDSLTIDTTTYDLEGTAGDYTTIQAAITAAATGDTITVQAGIYNTGSGESFPITLGKSLTLSGPNAAISPNTGTRVTEAIIDGQISLSGAIDDITIQGFHFEV
ncbi:unnamed protein product, partial [marine sediment metagenome]